MNDRYHFLSEIPVNARLLTAIEKKRLKMQLANLYNNFTTIRKFSTDIPYTLEENKSFLNKQKVSEALETLKDKVLNVLYRLESQNENQLKRFYYVFKASEVDIELVKTKFHTHNIKYEIPSKSELEAMYRSYILLQETSDKVMHFDDYIDTFLPAQIRVYPEVLFLGGYYRKTLFAKNYPSPLTDFHLAELSKHKNVNVMMKATEKKMTEVTKEIVKSKTNNVMQKMEGSIKSKMFAEHDDKTIDGLFSYMQDTQQKMFNVTLSVEIVAKTKEELQKKEEEVIASMNSITLDTVQYNALNLFKMANPLHDIPMKFLKRNMPSQTLACLNNANYSGRLKENGIFLGHDESGGLIFIDLHERNSDVTNGHFVIVADSGQGKSYLAKKILYNLHLINFDVMILDNEREYIDLTSNMHGLNVDPLQSSFIINPLEIKQLGFGQIEDTEDEQLAEQITAFRNASTLKQHIGWLRDFFFLYDATLTKKHLNVLEIILENFYKSKNITEETNFSTLTSQDYPILSDLFQYFLNVKEHLKETTNIHLLEAIPQELLDDLLLSIRPLALGSSSVLFNGHTSIKNASWLNIILQDLLEKNKEQKDLFLFNLCTHIWSETVKKKNTQKQVKPTLLFVDELYLLMNKYNPLLIHYFRMFTKRGRKYEFYLGTATQNLQDFNDSDIVSLVQPLFSIPKHKFIGFPGESELSLLRKFLNLTDGEIETISMSQRGHFLLLAGKNKYKLVVEGASELDRYGLNFEKELFGKAGGR